VSTNDHPTQVFWQEESAPPRGVSGQNVRWVAGVTRREDNTGMDAAIGVRDHSGWAVVVAVGGDPTAPEILLRERIQLVGDHLPRMAYHAALERDLDDGAALIAEVERVAEQGAVDALDSITERLRGDGHQVTGVAIAAGTSDVPTELEDILRSHRMVHAAEGELYREVMSTAAEKAGLPVTRYANKHAISEAAAALHVDSEALSQRLAAVGKPLGPPWQKDHREATAAALLVLAE